MKTGLTICLVLAAVALGKAERLSLLEGKLKIDIGDAFIQEEEAKADKKSELAHFAARDSDAWGAVIRGTHGIKPEGLADYMKNKVAEYTKGLSWLPKLKWLKKEIVTINGRPWADIRYIAPRTKPQNDRDGLLYTRVLATSYEGQLLEILFTSNTDENTALKDRIDKVMESVELEKPK